jgi:four helix bundle protein
MNAKAQQLEDRLVDFSVQIITLCEKLPDSKAGKHVGGQLLRSGTSPAPNYGEAQSAESRADFLHKLKIALKELRESLIWLKVIQRKPLLPENEAAAALQECNELISIFVKSIATAQRSS